ncbi:hypothetical protein PEPS_09100 [Persicobacter psychrovividus]|uniref:Uncharacterized protein n=1 Tax=Persicobacter psychrovividus TaxID=387638 RepID=A0ABM7VCZ1_9BACT|nr:hypothetical protein PEPS_09100 [Persicobacter psychrovividus]
MQQPLIMLIVVCHEAESRDSPTRDSHTFYPTHKKNRCKINYSGFSIFNDPKIRYRYWHILHVFQ